MWPALLLILLVAGLLALLPVWRLRVAGWSPGALFAAWLFYAIGILLAVRFAPAVRFLLPILVLAYVAPFVAGPERLSTVLRSRRPKPRVVIDVTPRDVTPDDNLVDDSPVDNSPVDGADGHDKQTPEDRPGGSTAP